MHGVHGGKAELDRQGGQHTGFSHAGRGRRASPALGGSCATRLVPRANGCVAVASLWQQNEAMRRPKGLLDLCAGKAGRQGWGNESIPSCAKSEPRFAKTQLGLFQGKASTFDLPLLALSLHLSAITSFLTLFCLFLLEFLCWRASLALGFAPRLLSNRCTVVTIQLNPWTAARDGPRHIARHGVRQERPSCIGAMVCNLALQRPGSRAKRLKSILWCVWPHRQLPIIALLCTK